jgi:hypothetical protein
MKTYQHYLYSVDGLANGATGILDISNPREHPGSYYHLTFRKTTTCA